jgi:3-isopropylmalate dehydrogenase
VSGWAESIAGRHPPGPPDGGPVRAGVLPGEGIGPEIVAVATAVMAAACRSGGRELELRDGPPPIAPGAGGSLSEAAADFCRDTFAAGGAVLTGPHGGRWVYELRARFDLFCKLSPLRPSPELDAVPGPIRPAALAGVDILAVREQSAGVYQGRWGESDVRRDGHVAEHSFAYARTEVRRILEVAAALAARRRGGLSVVVKEGGVPSISSLWRECAEQLAGGAGLDLDVLDIDFAVYRLIHEPEAFDVVVAPNLFGDVLADAGGALLGSRGLCYGGSFDAGRAAVFQTNHGGAQALAGSDRADPVGQVLAAAMMLREAFALDSEARSIEDAVAAAWREGWRTEDVAEPGSRVVGTREMGERIAERVGGTAAPTAPGPRPARGAAGPR